MPVIAPQLGKIKHFCMHLSLQISLKIHVYFQNLKNKKLQLKLFLMQPRGLSCNNATHLIKFFFKGKRTFHTQKSYVLVTEEEANHNQHARSMTSA